MRIAIFTDAYIDSAGGIPVTIDSQRKYLETQGHIVTVFCPARYANRYGFAIVDENLHSTRKGEADRHIYGVPLMKWLHIGGLSIGKRVSKIEEWIEDKIPDFEDRFDVIHVHYEFMCSIAGIRLAKRYGIPLVQTMHGRHDIGLGEKVPHPLQSASSRLISRAHQKSIPHSITVNRDSELAKTNSKARMWEIMVNHASCADIVITPSDLFGDQLARYGVRKEKLITVSNAVPDDFFEESILSEDFYVRKLHHGETLRLLWCNSVSREKRIMPFLRAIQLAEFPVFMEVYGEGNRLKAAKNFVERNELSERISFFGQVPNRKVIQRMADAHMCVMVSTGADAQSMSILEARATMLPVFLCDPELVSAAAPGGYVLSETKTPRDMAEALDRIYKNPECISEMSRACRDTREEIRQSVIGKSLIEAYEMAINNCRGRML